MGPSDHRGRPVGNQDTSHGGYRSTPRLAKMMARQITSNIRMGSPLSHLNAPEVTPAQAQQYLNSYREDRDKYGMGEFKGVSDKAQQIYNAIYFDRNGY